MTIEQTTVRRIGCVLAALICLTVLSLFAAKGARAEEGQWWERCNELPSAQIEACFYEHNGEKEPSEKGRRPTSPSVPVRAFARHRFPAARSVFVKCPKADATGEGSLVCEFRLIAKGRIVKGHAGVESETGAGVHTAWWLSSFHAERPLPRGRRRCSLPPRRVTPGAQSLVVYGTSCKEARDRAWRAEGIALTESDLRLPRRFFLGDPHTDTLGFVVTSFRCHGTAIVQPPVRLGLDPYGEETASCRTRFGDRFVYTFVIGN